MRAKDIVVGGVYEGESPCTATVLMIDGQDVFYRYSKVRGYRVSGQAQTCPLKSFAEWARNRVGFDERYGGAKP